MSLSPVLSGTDKKMSHLSVAERWAEDERNGEAEKEDAVGSEVERNSTLEYKKDTCIQKG